jgi:hypothetical protein
MRRFRCRCAICSTALWEEWTHVFKGKIMICAKRLHTCFVCGPGREDGLRVYAGPVEGRPGVVASPWTPGEKVRPELVWAALDCPSGWAVDDFQREGVLLGRMAAEIDRLPNSGEPHVVVGWRIGEDGRKRYAGSALLTAGGAVLARARSTWLVPRS